jgi:hypothetical protein
MSNNKSVKLPINERDATYKDWHDNWDTGYGNANILTA